jgi:hypothetical protein
MLFYLLSTYGYTYLLLIFSAVSRFREGKKGGAGGGSLNQQNNTNKPVGLPHTGEDKKISE